MKFDIDRDGMRQLNKQAEMLVLRLANLGKAYAKQNAPVDTGRLRDSIDVEKPTRDGEKIVTKVVAQAPYALNAELRAPYLVPALGEIERGGAS